MDQAAVAKANRLRGAPHGRISATEAGRVLEKREGTAADPTGTMKARTMATLGTMAAEEVAGRSTSGSLAVAMAAMITSGGSAAATVARNIAASVDLAAFTAKQVAREKESPIPFISCNYDQDLQHLLFLPFAHIL
jgi:hypothetical protein